MSRRRLIGGALGGAAVAGVGLIGFAAGRRNQEADGPPSIDPGPGSTIATPERPTSSVDASGRPGLPFRTVAMWLNAFELPTVRQLPTDVVASVNMFIFGMAQSAAAGTGRLDFHPYQQDPIETAQDIRSMVALGKPVLLGIGGSDDGGITLTDDRQVDEFCTAIDGYVEQYGFTGIDIDLEPSGSTWSQEALVSAIKRIKQQYGPGFLVGLTVGLYGEYTDGWLRLADALGDDYDYWAPMLYDFPEAHDERLIPEAMKKIAQAADGGIPPEKQILGFMCNAYYNTSPVAVTGQVWQTALAQYPNLRGAFIWESRIEQANAYEWTRQVGAGLIAQS